LSVHFLRCGKDGGFERNGPFENNVTIVWISDRKNVMILIECSEEGFIIWAKYAEELVDKVWSPDLAGVESGFLKSAVELWEDGASEGRYRVSR
jgi:hypothetical protein